MGYSEIDTVAAKAILMVSQNEKYQKKIMMVTILLCLEIALANLNNSTIFTNPLFKCGGVVTPESIACLRPLECSVENDYTGTFQVGLICENSYFRMNVQALFTPGLILGLFLFSLLADCKGRKYSLVFMMVVLTSAQILLLVGIMGKYLWMIAVAQFFCGFSSSAGLNVSYTIAKELFTDSRRQTATLAYCSAWSLVDVVVFFVYETAPYWWTYLVILGIFPSIYLTYYAQQFFVETPQFLISIEADIPKGIESLHRIGSYNQVDQESLQKAKQLLRTVCTQNQNCSSRQSVVEKASGSMEIFKKIYRNKESMKLIVCMSLIKFGFYAFYYGALGCLERTGYSFGVSILILGVGEYLGYWVGNLFIEKIKRKTLLICSNIAKVLFGLTFLTETVSSSSVLSSLVLATCFFLGSFNFSAISILETETLPASIQATAIGLIFMLSFISRLFLPYMIGFMNEENIHPLAACSVTLLVFGMVPSFFIKETLKSNELGSPFLENHQQIQIEMENVKTDGDLRNRISNIQTSMMA